MNANEPAKGTQHVQVIELRNYLLRPGHRDQFISEFEDKLVDTLNARGNLILGQFRVKGAEDNFLWIRGFRDMPSRAKALREFYSSDYWATQEHIPIRHLLNYGNVHLLKPLDISKNKEENFGFPMEWFGRPKGVAVVDLYVANERLNDLIDFFRTRYDSLLKASGLNEISYWISEQKPNDYPGIPAFQDKNLLVTISFYKNEQEYLSTMKNIERKISKELKNEMLGIVTTETSLILYPTKRSLSKTK
jgi:hypothetical protein